MCNGQLTAIRWNDNAVVAVLSNCDGCEPKKNAQRLFRPERKRKKNVQIPNADAQYNSNMGGVELNDQFTAQYRTKIRTKKWWWWCTFAWAVDTSCVQGWLLYRLLGHDMPSLKFRRQVVLQILAAHGSPKPRPGPKSLSFQTSLDDARKDCEDHLITKGTSKYRRCKLCEKRDNIPMCKMSSSTSSRLFSKFSQILNYTDYFDA